MVKILHAEVIKASKILKKKNTVRHLFIRLFDLNAKQQPLSIDHRNFVVISGMKESLRDERPSVLTVYALKTCLA